MSSGEVMAVQTTIPGPKGQFLLGSINEFNNNTLEFVKDIRRYGDLAKFKFGPFPIFVVSHPDYIHDVMVKNADKYYKPSFNKAILEAMLGNGLFINDGDSWKRQRRLVQPAFHAKRISAYADIITNYANELGDEWQKGGTRRIDLDMTAITMRIIAKALFDADIRHDTAEVGEAIRDALEVAEGEFKTPFPIPRWLPLERNRKLRRVVARLDKLIQDFINERRASSEDKGDLLSLLLSARDEDNTTMTDKQVRDEAMTLFGAGHETTAVTMTWIWYLLSQNPQAEAKLHEELDHVLGGRLPTMEDLALLPYTEMIVKEAMRMYPAAWGTSREVHEPVLLGGHMMKKRQTVFINIYGMHYDPRFFENPEQFNPERFSAENEKLIPKYAYVPFGAGPRICIGNAFAIMEARLILATLAQRFELSVAPNFKVVPDRQFTLKPKYGLEMVIQERVVRQ
jgi:cytochrome P450